MSIFKLIEQICKRYRSRLSSKDSHKIILNELSILINKEWSDIINIDGVYINDEIMTPNIMISKKLMREMVEKHPEAL